MRYVVPQLWLSFDGCSCGEGSELFRMAHDIQAG
jgi:hypothetical protein